MRKKENEITLSKLEKNEAVDLIKSYLSEEFDIETGNLRAEFFVDFITEHIGKYYYNHGISDSMIFFNDRIEDLYILMKD